MFFLVVFEACFLAKSVLSLVILPSDRARFQNITLKMGFEKEVLRAGNGVAPTKGAKTLVY